MAESSRRKPLPRFLPERAPLNRPKAVEIRFEQMGYELEHDAGPTLELTADTKLRSVDLPKLRGQALLDWIGANTIKLSQADAYLLLRNRDQMLNASPDLRRKIIHFFGTRWKNQAGLVFVPVLFASGSQWHIRLDSIEASRSPKDIALTL